MSNDVTARLMAWLHRHPLKRPPQAMQTAYTDEVMARVRASAPAPAFQWVLRPRMVFGFGTAIAFGMAVVVLTHRAPDQVASHAEHASQVLAELGELNGVSGNELEDEAAALDHMMLAEADTSADDEAWVQETAELLNEVGDSSAQPSDEGSLEELLKELESLDESDIASS